MSHNYLWVFKQSHFNSSFHKVILTLYIVYPSSLCNSKLWETLETLLDQTLIDLDFLLWNDLFTWATLSTLWWKICYQFSGLLFLELSFVRHYYFWGIPVAHFRLELLSWIFIATFMKNVLFSRGFKNSYLNPLLFPD